MGLNLERRPWRPAPRGGRIARELDGVAQSLFGVEEMGVPPEGSLAAQKRWRRNAAGN